MTSKDSKFEWDEEYGTTTCFYYYKDKTFIGQAFCAEDDHDMMSRRTGEYIAAGRARIKYFQYIKNYEITPRLRALKQLYYSINRSKKYNPKSYEAHMIQHQIQIAEEDLMVCRDAITEERRDIQRYIDIKDKMYKQIRHDRAVGEQVNID